MQAVSHEHAVKSWLQWEINGGSRELVLVVETDLELDPGAEGFESGKLDDFLYALVVEFSERDAQVERVDVLPAGRA